MVAKIRSIKSSETKEFTVMHFFCGSGGGALGFQGATEEYAGLEGSYRTLGGIDVNPRCCEDFKYLTGVKATCLDLFDRRDYIDFHGKEPGTEWHEVGIKEILEASNGEYPNVVFLSPPCKGLTGLLSEEKANTKKYQALNRLVVRGLFLSLEAYKKNPPDLYLMENVPRIKTRGKSLLHTVKGLLRSYGYSVDDRDHDCGEIGGLGQHRKRYLLIARNQSKMPNFVYIPPKQRVKAIGEILDKLPLPDEPIAGPMHRLPKLQWKTWVRLALIPAGGDWRDLEKIAHESYWLEHIPRGSGSHGVQEWNEPGNTVTSKRGGSGSTTSNVSDPRLKERAGRHPGVYRVVKFDEPSPCVTGTRFGSGSPAISDPRTGFKEGTHKAIYRVIRWDKESNTVTGAYRPNNGALSISDPRFKCSPRDGTMGVLRFNEPAKCVTSGDIHSCSAAIADPRVPKDNESGVFVIISTDGTWHRPLTTWELAALQGFPLWVRGKPLNLSGSSDASWRERIGNAVPPPAAKAIAKVVLRGLLLASENAWELSNEAIWVSPKVDWNEVRLMS
ncbi:MAG: DNA cytosine methyltransferase [Bacillota bacterium]